MSKTAARRHMYTETKRIQTTYSSMIAGDEGNYHRGVRFDSTTGYIGVDQKTERGVERVLLSPRQARALVRWIRGEPTP